MRKQIKNYALYGILFLLIFSCKGRNDNSNEFSNKSNDNQKSRIFTDYYKNGTIKQTGRYENGLKFGVWRDYNSYGKVTQVKCYNADTILFDNLDITDYDFKKTSFSEGAFTISYPSNWELLPVDSPVNFASRKKTHDTVDFSPNIVVLIYNRKKADFKSEVAYNMSVLDKEYTSYKVMSGKTFTINGKQAKRYEYIAVANLRKVAAMATFIELSNEKTMIITGMASNDPLGSYFIYRDIFEMVSNSIEFL